MNATLSKFGLGGDCGSGRRRYKTICKTLESGEKIELVKEVLNADDPYDYSEGNEDAGSPLASDDEASCGEELAESKMETASAPMPEMASATLLSAAALAEHKRLKELHAQVRADPRSAVELLKPEQIGCASCHTGKSHTKADSDSESESGSESGSESSSSEEVVVECVATKQKKKKCDKPKKEKKCAPKPAPVCEHKKPCNKIDCNDAIVKARMAKEKCALQDVELTKTYEAWAKSMSQFEQSKNELCGNSSSSSNLTTSITKSNINAEKMIDEFVAKGGLKIDEKLEKASLNKLVTAIGACKPIEVMFEHKYIASKNSVAAAGSIDVKRHVQPLTIKVSGHAEPAKKVYYLDLSVKPSDAPDSYYRTTSKVFQLKVSACAEQPTSGGGAMFSGAQEARSAQLKAEVLQKGLKEMTNELSVPVTREAVKKIGELISLIA